MRPETEKQVESLRQAVKAANEELNHVKTTLAGNDDKYINGLIRQASFWLDDVETFFIGMLREERMPPRTLAEESTIVSNAARHFDTVALPLVKNIRDLVARYGPTITSVG